MSARVRLSLDEDLGRRRLAVLLRAPLALPPAVAVAVWTVPAAAALGVAWPATLVLGRAPRRLHRFLQAYLLAWTQLAAWAGLVSGRYPPLRHRERHPVQLEAPRLPQRRPVTLVRAALAVPGIVLSSVLAVVLGGTAVAAWLAALVLGRTTVGLRELGAFCLRYQVETLAFLLLLSPHAPRLEPPAMPPQAP